jgi:internalin A
LESLTNLKELDLSDNSINEIQGLETLTKLEKFDLSHNSVKEIQGLGNLRNLQELDLSWNKIKKIQGLENLTNLKELYLWDITLRAKEGVNGYDIVDYYGDNPIRFDEWDVVYWMHLKL